MSSTSRVCWPSSSVVRKATVRKAPSRSLMPCSVGNVVAAQPNLALSASSSAAAVGKKTLSSGVGRKKLCLVGPLIFTAAFTKLRLSMPRNSARLLQSSVASRTADVLHYGPDAKSPGGKGRLVGRIFKINVMFLGLALAFTN